MTSPNLMPARPARHASESLVVGATLRSKAPRVRREWDAYESRLDAVTVEHFWKFVDKRGPDECWPWLRSTDKAGYGTFSLFPHCRTNARAHRIAFGLANGGIPKGMQVLHTCDNPPCCNPAHLFAGTHQDNMADKKRKGRNPGQKQTHCKRGHEFTPENTYVCLNKGRGYYRRCATCEKNRGAVRPSRRKAA